MTTNDVSLVLTTVSEIPATYFMGALNMVRMSPHTRFSGNDTYLAYACLALFLLYVFCVFSQDTIFRESFRLPFRGTAVGPPDVHMVRWPAMGFGGIFLQGQDNRLFLHFCIPSGDDVLSAAAVGAKGRGFSTDKISHIPSSLDHCPPTPPSSPRMPRKRITTVDQRHVQIWVRLVE